MSAGMRSGVNWMRLNVRSSAAASVRTSNVLPMPGTPSSSPCPPASRQVSTSSMAAFWPTITRETCSRTAAWFRRKLSIRRAKSEGVLFSPMIGPF